MTSATRLAEVSTPPAAKEVYDTAFVMQESPHAALMKKDSQPLRHTRINEMDFIQPAPPTPQLHVELMANRFVMFVVIAVAFSVCFNIVFLIGITVESNILEEIGSSKKATDSVEKFNTISGYVMAFVGLALDLFYGCFLNVFMVYLHNLPWYRGDDANVVDTSPTAAAKAKRIGMFLFAFAVPFALKNSFSSLQAGQSTVGFAHVMTQEDLAFQDPLRYIPKNKSLNGPQSIKTNSVQLTNRAIETTILKNALREETEPFSFDTKSECVRKTKKTTSTLETLGSKMQLNVQDLAATAVVYGFAPKEWNREMLPNGLTANFSDPIAFSEFVDNPDKFSTSFNLLTALEMILQGKMIFERSVSDSNPQTYECTLSDGRGDELDLSADDPWLVEQRQQTPSNPDASANAETNSPQPNPNRRRLDESGDESLDSEWFNQSSGNADVSLDDEVDWMYNTTSGKRLCNGVISSLKDLQDYKNKTNHNLEYVLEAVARGLDTSLPAIAVEDTSVTFEQYKVNDQIQLETIRVDLQFNSSINYGAVPLACVQEILDPKDEYYLTEAEKSALCDSSIYLFMNHGDFCGSKNCTFLDGSKSFSLRKEVAMIPYMKDCDTDKLRYDEDYNNFFPTNCQAQNDSVFVYGLGSYVSGTEYGSSLDDTGVPYILNPRRHVRMTFAKISWNSTQLDDAFDAECSTNSEDCLGLAFKLEPSGRYLFMGENAFPREDLNQAGFHQPIPLVRLNSRQVYVRDFGDSVDFERINTEYFNVTKWDATKNQNLTGENCSMLMDSFMNQIENNKYFLEKPLQVMYTSALFFLFQDAGITQLNDTKLLSNPQLLAQGRAKDRFFNLKLNGDETVRQIRVKIPVSSAITTFVGCGVMLVLTCAVLVWPTRRLLFLPGASMAEEFIEMHTEKYSTVIHDKCFKFQTGEAVPTSDYEAESVVLVHAEDRDQAIRLY